MQDTEVLENRITQHANPQAREILWHPQLSAWTMTLKLTLTMTMAFEFVHQNRHTLIMAKVEKMPRTAISA